MKNVKPFLVVDQKRKKDKDEAQPASPIIHETRNRHPKPWDTMMKGYTDKLKSGVKTVQLMRQVYHEDEVIGPPVFQQGLSATIKTEVLHSPIVKAAIEEYRVANPHYSQKDAESHAAKLLDRMSTNYNETVLRAMSTTVHYILSRLYNGIHINQQQIDRVREVAARAQEEGVPLIVLPTHKSHIDYLVVSYIFFLSNISLPFIAAGDNLMIPLVGSLLRRSGAFFIRRKFDNDKLYRALFNEYITQFLAKGYNLEFFIEGGRSRTGKLLRPKMGLLSVAVEGVLRGRIKNAYCVPVSIGYDKVIETESYVKELLGGAKERESISGLLKSAKLLQLSFGRIDVRIARPFSMAEFLQEQIAKRQLNPLSKHGDMRILSQALAYSILFSINKASVIMPTAIVVTVLLTHRGRGISRKELILKFDWLKEQILSRNGKGTEQLVDTALNVLGSLIGRQKDTVEPVFTPMKRFELSYYRNQVIHLFANESVVACSLYAHSRQRGLPVKKNVLLEDVSFLSQLLKKEIVYQSSTNTLETAFEEALKEMIKRGTVTYNEGDNTVTICPEGYSQFDFLCALFWPFIDCYWLASACFYSLWPTYMIEEKTFLNKVQQVGFTLYHQGELNYYESVSKETLYNAILLFLELQIVETQVIDNKGLTVIRLAKPYQESEQGTITFIERIGKYRREGRYAQNQDHFNQKMRDIIKLASPSIAKL